MANNAQLNVWVKLKDQYSDRFRNITKQTTRGSKKMTKSLQGLQTALKGVVTYMAFREMGRVLANFTRQMSMVEGITNAAANAMTRMRDEAKYLGRTTMFTASQAARGMTILARAGLSAQNITRETSSVLRFARANMMDLGRAADVTVKAVRAFKLPMSEITRVSDVFTKSAMSATTTAGELAHGFAYLAPTAKTAGLSIEEAAAAMDVLANSGIIAGMGGRQLRMAIAKLFRPTDNAQKAMESLGVTIEDLNVKQRGLVPVLKELRDANITLSEAQMLFGTRAMNAMMILTDNIPMYERLVEKNENAAGATAELAEKMGANLYGAFKRVASAAQGLLFAMADVDTSLGVTLRAASETAAKSIRLLARNTEIVKAAITVLAVKAIPKLVAAVQGLWGLFLTNPWTAAFAAAAGVVALLENRVNLVSDALEFWPEVIGNFNDKLDDAIKKLEKTGEKSRAVFVYETRKETRKIEAYKAHLRGMKSMIEEGFMETPVPPRKGGPWKRPVMEEGYGKLALEKRRQLFTEMFPKAALPEAGIPEMSRVMGGEIPAGEWEKHLKEAEGYNKTIQERLDAQKGIEASTEAQAKSAAEIYTDWQKYNKSLGLTKEKLKEIREEREKGIEAALEADREWRKAHPPETAFYEKAEWSKGKGMYEKTTFWEDSAERARDTMGDLYDNLEKMNYDTWMAMSNTMGNVFFDVMWNKCDSFKDYLKSFLEDITRSLSSFMADQSVQMFLGMLTGGGKDKPGINSEQAWMRRLIQGIGAGITAGVGGIGSLFGGGGGGAQPHVGAASGAGTTQGGGAAGAGSTTRMGTKPGGYRALQHGGIVEQPTFALAGERGPEAFIPLSRGRRVPVETRGGGNVVHHHHYEIRAVDAPSFQRLLESEKATIGNLTRDNIARRTDVRQAIKETR